jgi:SAM-dependent methyltransferase
MSELRPDLKLCSVDLAGVPENYPKGCDFQRADLEREQLRWPDSSMDAVTCMQLIEHLHNLDMLQLEITRLLRPGGRVYFETPHPKSMTLSSPPGKAAGTFTFNFFDDGTHLRPVAIGALAQSLRAHGLEVVESGISRNWLFAASYPLFFFLSASRRKLTAHAHWLGWSAYVIARRK